MFVLSLKLKASVTEGLVGKRIPSSIINHENFHDLTDPSQEMQIHWKVALLFTWPTKKLYSKAKCSSFLSTVLHELILRGATAGALPSPAYGYLFPEPLPPCLPPFLLLIYFHAANSITSYNKPYGVYVCVYACVCMCVCVGVEGRGVLHCL